MARKGGPGCHTGVGTPGMYAEYGIAGIGVADDMVGVGGMIMYGANW